MAWQRGYYYRSKREGGSVRREYVGKGHHAELIAQMDALERQRREMQRADLRLDHDRAEALDRPVAELDELADLLAEAALTAAGYHRHHRGEWRKRRGNRDQAG